MNTTPRWQKIVLTLFTAMVIANLAYLDYREFRQSPTPIPSPTLKKALRVGKPESGFSVYTVTDEEGDEVEVVDLALVTDQIKEATAALTREIQTLTQAPLTITAPQAPQSQTISPSPAPLPQAATVKEHYIPLGSGSTTATDWDDLPGVEAYLAPANYGNVVGVYFEAALRNPTGNGQAYARLKNVTDNYSLVESEVTFSGSGGKLMSSGKLPTPVHTKLYRVELKSSLGAEIVLDNARLKIFVE